MIILLGYWIGLLWIVLLCIFIYKSLCVHMFSFLFGDTCVILLDHLVNLCLTLKGIAKQLFFFKWLYNFTFLPIMYEGFQLLQIITNTFHCISFLLEPFWWFWLVFPSDQWCVFTSAFTLLCIFLEEMWFKSFVHF